jgi:hypothetical protein
MTIASKAEANGWRIEIPGSPVVIPYTYVSTPVDIYPGSVIVSEDGSQTVDSDTFNALPPFPPVVPEPVEVTAETVDPTAPAEVTPDVSNESATS